MGRLGRTWVVLGKVGCSLGGREPSLVSLEQLWAWKSAAGKPLRRLTRRCWGGGL